MATHSLVNLQTWLNNIDDITASFKTSFGELTEEQLNLKPDSNTWSIAQNIEHLIVINKTYEPVIQRAHAKDYKLPWTSKINFIVNFFGKMILNSVQPNRKRKMKTFPMWEPAKSRITGDILKRFSDQQSVLKEMIKNSGNLLQSGTVIS